MNFQPSQCFVSRGLSKSEGDTTVQSEPLEKPGQGSTYEGYLSGKWRRHIVTAIDHNTIRGKFYHNSIPLLLWSFNRYKTSPLKFLNTKKTLAPNQKGPVLTPQSQKTREQKKHEKISSPTTFTAGVSHLRIGCGLAFDIKTLLWSTRKDERDRELKSRNRGDNFVFWTKWNPCHKFTQYFQICYSEFTTKVNRFLSSVRNVCSGGLLDLWFFLPRW